jgi:integrase
VLERAEKNIVEDTQIRYYDLVIKQLYLFTPEIKVNSMKKWIPLSHIRTKPPIPYAIIEWLINDIEHGQDNHKLLRQFKANLNFAYLRNGRVLATALKFAYFLGFSTGEILQLRVRHVLDENLTVRGAISFDGNQINIGHLTQTIAEYCSYLRTIYGKKFQLDLPLFPDMKKKKSYKKVAYDKSTIVRHINYFSEVTGYDITIEKIRQSGICRFYDGLGATRPGYHVQSDALESTAKFARVESARHAYHILIGKIDEWGGREKSSVTTPVLIEPEKITEQIRRSIASLSEIAAMKIIDKDLPKARKSLSKMAELRNEFSRVISGAANLDSSVKERLVERFDAKLQSIGFRVNQNDGSLSVLDGFIYED